MDNRNKQTTLNHLTENKNKQGIKAYILEYVTIAADEANLTEKSKKNRRCAFNRLLTYLEDKPFTYEELRAYLGHLRTSGIYISEKRTPKPWSDIAIAKEIALIRAFLTYLVKQKYITENENFGSRLIKPIVHEKIRELPSLVDAVKIITSGTEPSPCKKGHKGDNIISIRSKETYREAMLFGIDTGLRFKEIKSIVPERIYLNNSFPFLVIKAKGGNEQKVIIPHHQVEVLKKRIKFKNIFPINVDTCNRLLKNGSEKIGMPAITMHDLRRVYALNLDENGANSFQIKDALRHTSVLTTQRYVKHSPSRMNKITHTYQDRNRHGLPIDKTFDFIEQEVKRLIEGDDRFTISIVRENGDISFNIKVAG